MKKNNLLFFAKKDFSSSNYTDTNRNVDALNKDKKNEGVKEKKGLTY